MSRGAVFALLIGLQAIMLAAHDDAPGPGPDTDRVRAMTYNIHQGWPGDGSGHHNLHEVADVIRAADPHIVALQESETSRITSGHMDAAAWLAHELGMHLARGPPASAGIYGVAVLSQWPLTDASWSHLPHPESVERVLVQAVAQSPRGSLPVFATHFGIMEVPAERLAQAHAVAAAMAHLPSAILMGDLNTQPDEAAYHVLETSLTDAWAAANPGDAGLTMTADDPRYRIDHVMVRGLDVVGARVLGGPEASDHRAVVADLVWPT